jgi:hypothetical protein
MSVVLAILGGLAALPVSFVTGQILMEIMSRPFFEVVGQPQDAACAERA